MSKFPVPGQAVYVCTGSKCAKRGGKALYKTLKGFAKHHDLEVIRTECTHRCDWAPVCAIQPGNTWLKEYRERDVLKLLLNAAED